MEHRDIDPRDDPNFTIPSYDIPELAIPHVVAQANKRLAESRAAQAAMNQGPLDRTHTCALYSAHDPLCAECVRMESQGRQKFTRRAK